VANEVQETVSSCELAIQHRWLPESKKAKFILLVGAQ